MNLKIMAVGVENTPAAQHRGALKLLYDIYGDEAEIKKSPSGKPFIHGADSEYKHFNISHSNNYAVCVFSEEIEVGIDIEKIRPINQRIIDRFLNGCHQDEAIRSWTRRESFGKMTGKGFSDVRYDEVTHTFQEYTDIEGYIITVCAASKNVNFPENILWYQTNEVG